MKKIATILTLLLIASLSFAQQKYFAFSINGKNGITDTSGQEIMNLFMRTQL